MSKYGYYIFDNFKYLKIFEDQSLIWLSFKGK
jgi:hypothetical protein